MSLPTKSGRWFLAASLWLFASACVRSGGGGGPREIVLGEFTSLTGPQAPYGTAAHKGIQLAVEEVNQEGGLGGRKVRLVTLDDEGTAEGVARTVRKLTAEGALILLGEMATSLSLVGAPLAQADGVPMISPGSTSPSVTQVGDFVFRVCFTDPFQGAVMARFALNYLQLKRAAILMDKSSEYSRGLAEHFAREYGNLGGKIVATHFYEGREKEYRKLLQPLLAQKPDILFLPGYYEEVGLAAKTARKMGFKGVFLGGDGWDSERLIKVGGKAVVGSYFSDHFSAKDRNPEVQRFDGRYRQKYQETPNALAAVGYDAARVALDAFRRVPSLDRHKLRKALSQTSNFPGVTGIITLDSRRDAVKPAVVLKVSADGANDYVTTINP